MDHPSQSFMRQYKTSPEFRKQFVSSSLAMAVAMQVREIRAQRGMTQAALAKAAGITTVTIARIEKGTDLSCSMRTLYKIAEAFDCALVIRFISHSEFIEWIFTITCNGVDIVPRFIDDKEFMDPCHG